ncbi:ABC transporter permease [Shinella zoogloeoides]|uniref:ABC transporter permease n=1 Tax=Shinella zoogloeoides TaxID=352475 RepID=UPI00273EA349|nr:ABC transporter permease [Shinella zoogloeoides]WLR95738.1 ABC transporter permease [Shinella zoogloeoides]
MSDNKVFSWVAQFRRGQSAKAYPPAVSLLLVSPLISLLFIGFVYPVARLVQLSFANGAEPYVRLVQGDLYIGVLIDTVLISAVVAALCLILGYPVALAMARLKRRAALLVTACVFVPLWTSILIRSYAWVVLLQRNGLVNDLLQATGLSDGPLRLLYTQGAVILAMTHVLLPFAILPIQATLRSLPADLTRAASNLGATPIRAFLLITLPLSLPGIFAGTLLCFVLALGFYITPALVGGPSSMMMATLIGQQTLVVLDWPFAAALSTLLLTVSLLLVAVFRRALAQSKGFSSAH